MYLDYFADEIEEKIIKRGEQYFTSGAIDELWQDSHGNYCAVINGAEPYEIKIAIDPNGQISEHACDCPYDWGEYCKHEVAVLLAIREARTDRRALPNKRTKKKHSLKAFLKKQRKTDLIDLICEYARKYGLVEEIRYYFENYDDHNE